MKVKVNQSNTIRVTPAVQQSTEVVAVGVQGPPGPSGILNISDAQDVNVDDLTDGSVLVYTMEKWTSTKLLNQQIMEAGEY